MSFVYPSWDELPLPSTEEFNRRPEFYMEKLRQYRRKQDKRFIRQAIVLAICYGASIFTVVFLAILSVF